MKEKLYTPDLAGSGQFARCVHCKKLPTPEGHDHYLVVRQVYHPVVGIMIMIVKVSMRSLSNLQNIVFMKRMVIQQCSNKFLIMSGNVHMVVGHSRKD